MGLYFGRTSFALAVLAVVLTFFWPSGLHQFPAIIRGAMMDKSSREAFMYVSGFFKHDQQPTGPEPGFRAHTLPGLGIIERPYDSDTNVESVSTQWQRFENHIRHLNAVGAAGVRYGVLFVARHGEGVHNVKEREVGRQAWERKWSKLEGDGSAVWLDASLTQQGQKQATALRDFWAGAIDSSKVPAPERYYTSPLMRCLQTVDLTFAYLPLPVDRPFSPMVKEALREIHGVHTCDRRSSLQQIHSRFPNFEIEVGFAEEDILWDPGRREAVEDRVPVMRRFLSEVFDDQNATFVSLTTHSGAIRALYKAIGHPDVWVAAGAVVPIVVRRSQDV